MKPVRVFQGFVAAILLGLCVSSPLLFYRVQSVQEHQNDGLHAVICFAENIIKHSKRFTPAQKTHDIEIYDHMIEVAHLDSCK